MARLAFLRETMLDTGFSAQVFHQHPADKPRHMLLKLAVTARQRHGCKVADAIAQCKVLL